MRNALIVILSQEVHKLKDTQKSKQLVKEALQTIYHDGSYDKETISRYFSESYLHFVGNKVKTRDMLIAHLEEIMPTFESTEIKLLDIIAEPNKVLTSHLLKAKFKNADLATWHGLAIFYIKNNKISKSIELLRTIENPDDDPMLLNLSQEEY